MLYHSPTISSLFFIFLHIEVYLLKNLRLFGGPPFFSGMVPAVPPSFSVSHWFQLHIHTRTVYCMEISIYNTYRELSLVCCKIIMLTINSLCLSHSILFEVMHVKKFIKKANPFIFFSFNSLWGPRGRPIRLRVMLHRFKVHGRTLNKGFPNRFQKEVSQIYFLLSFLSFFFPHWC